MKTISKGKYSVQPKGRKVDAKIIKFKDLEDPITKQKLEEDQTRFKERIAVQQEQKGYLGP